MRLPTGGVEETLRAMVGQLARENVISDEASAFDALLQRESSQSTGLGNGIAIPHAVHSQLDSTVIQLALSPEGVDFRALDERPVHVFFLLLSPPESSGTHIKLLARIARLMREPGFLQRLLATETAEEAIARVRETDEEHP